MKKILLMTLAAAVGAAWAEDVTIEALNIVGIQPVTGTSTKSSEMTLPMPFVGIGSTDESPKDATLQEALYAENLSFGEMARLCLNSPSGYFYNWLATGGLIAGTDFYPSARTEGSVNLTPAAATEQTVPVGAGITLVASATKKTAYVMGQYDADALKKTVTVAGGSRSYFANPLDEEFALENITGTPNIDLVTVYNADGTQTEYYYNKTEGSTTVNGVTTTGHWFVRRLGTPTINGTKVVTKVYKDFLNPKIAPGMAFSYERRKSGSVSFVWKK